MLVAQQQNGELFLLTKTIAAEELQSLKEQQTFFCPQCHAQLMLKIGRIKIPHFAHYKHSACEQAFSEGETVQHILGKQQLYTFFESKQLPVKLEHTITALQQRPDLFIEYNQKHYAIEYQCSPIQEELFYARTNGYKSAQIEPIWILKTPTSIQAAGIQRYTVNSFQQLFWQSYKRRLYMMTYHPEQQRFFYLSPLLHVHKNQWIVQVEQLPLMYQTFPFLRPKAPNFNTFQIAYQLHQKSLLHSLQSTIKYSRQGTQNLFLRYMYELRLSLAELPPFLKLPILKNEEMHALASGWQCALFYFAQQLEKPIWSLKMSEVQLFFTCMKLPYTAQNVQVLRRYARLCKKFNITSIHVKVAEERLIEALYEQYQEDEYL